VGREAEAVGVAEQQVRAEHEVEAPAWEILFVDVE